MKIVITIIGWLLAVISSWNILCWIGVLFPDKLSLYIANINREGVTFTYASFMTFALGTIFLEMIRLVSCILFSMRKEIWRKTFLFSFVAFLFYDLIWLIANILMRRSIIYFIGPIFVAGVFLCVLTKVLNFSRIKTQFK